MDKGLCGPLFFWQINHLNLTYDTDLCNNIRVLSDNVFFNCRIMMQFGYHFMLKFVWAYSKIE